MKPIFNFVLIITFIFIATISRPTSAYAQDTGTPFFKVVTIAGLIGTAVGSGVSASIWLLDPLNPNTSLGRSLMRGIGIGAIVGIVGGFVYMQMHAIVPISDPNESIDDATSKRRPLLSETQNTLLFASLDPPQKSSIHINIINLHW